MSRTKPTEFQELELAADCESCGQPAGYWCVTKSGRRTEYLHSCRHYLARVREARELPFTPQRARFRA